MKIVRAQSLREKRRRDGFKLNRVTFIIYMGLCYCARFIKVHLETFEVALERLKWYNICSLCEMG